MCLNRCRVSKSFIRNSFLLVIGLLTATIGGTGYAFVRLSTNGNELFWPNATNQPISFVIANGTANGITQASYEGAVRRAFQAWEEVPESGISFTEDTNPGSKNRTDYTADDIHTVMFDANNSTGFFGNSGLVAVTPVEFTGQGQITDADIILNARDHTFSTTNAANTFDVQSVVTHEVGHFIGLDHSPVLGATMVPFALQNNLLQRSLETDDAAAATAAYPNVNAMNAQLRGRIVNSGNDKAGAHVVAENTDGSVAATTVSNNDGTFVLAGLDSQKSYRVYAEPLDGPVVANNLSTGISNLRVDTDFGTTYYGGFQSPTEFVPGNGFTVDIGTLDTFDPAQPQPMNITSTSRTSGVIGTTVSVTLSTENLRQSDTIRLSSPDLNVSNVVISGAFGTFVTLDVTIPANAVPGLYSFQVDRDVTGECVVLTGGFEVIRPAPTAENITPDNVDGTTDAIVSIFGTNFVDGLKVIIGNTILDNATVVAPNELQFSLLNVAIEPGTHEVRVENPDGQFDMLPMTLTITASSSPEPVAPPPPPGGGGGGGGGGCSVSAAPVDFAGGLGNLLPLLFLAVLALRRRS